MTNNPMKQFMISLPDSSIEVLRKIAAQRNLDDPTQVTSAAQVGREIILQFLRNEQEKSFANRNRPDGRVEQK